MVNRLQNLGGLNITNTQCQLIIKADFARPGNYIFLPRMPLRPRHPSCHILRKSRKNTQKRCHTVSQVRACSWSLRRHHSCRCHKFRRFREAPPPFPTPPVSRHKKNTENVRKISIRSILRENKTPDHTHRQKFNSSDVICSKNTPTLPGTFSFLG